MWGESSLSEDICLNEACWKFDFSDTSEEAWPNTAHLSTKWHNRHAFIHNICHFTVAVLKLNAWRTKHFLTSQYKQTASQVAILMCWQATDEDHMNRYFDFFERTLDSGECCSKHCVHNQVIMDKLFDEGSYNNESFFQHNNHFFFTNHHFFTSDFFV